MRLRLLSASLCILCLFTAAAASAADDIPPPSQPATGQAKATPHLPPSADVGLWLSQQLHRTVQASQILLAPDAAALQGCTIARARRAPTGATALSLRCPAPALPRLLLLDLSRFDIADSPPFAIDQHEKRENSPHRQSSGQCGQRANRSSATCETPPSSPSIVHAGAALRADWRTAFIHAQFPVVALDSGAAGTEIRVRIPRTNRIIRARILSATAVAIIGAGV